MERVIKHAHLTEDDTRCGIFNMMRVGTRFGYDFST